MAPGVSCPGYGVGRFRAARWEGGEVLALYLGVPGPGEGRRNLISALWQSHLPGTSTRAGRDLHQQPDTTRRVNGAQCPEAQHEASP